jgi:uncharacterized membrane protein YdjX (TVP38/TMEM64 family)
MALDDAIGRRGGVIVFLSQVHPLFPTSLLQYVYGVTRIRFWPCMGWVAVGQAPGLFLYVYLGTLAQHGMRVMRGEAHPRAIEYVLWIGGFVLAVAVATGLGRVALRVMRESRAGALEEEETDKKKIAAGEISP